MLSAGFISTLLLLLVPFHLTATEKLLHSENKKEANKNLRGLLVVRNRDYIEKLNQKDRKKNEDNIRRYKTYISELSVELSDKGFFV